MMIHDKKRFRKWSESLGLQVDFVMNEQYLCEEDCLKISPDYDGWIAGDDQVTEKVLRHFTPKLKVISKWGTGIDSIDVDSAEELGVQVKNSVGAFASAVGEIAVAYALNLTRGINQTHTAVLQGGWPKKQYKDMSQLCVGLLGLGAIGSGVADRLQPFGCRIIYHDPFIKNSEYESYSLEKFASTADVFILTANLNDATRNIIGYDFLQLVKDGSFLINVSRGQLIDENELQKALYDGRLAGVALDVYQDEPLPQSSSLLNYSNVIFGSHNANNTLRAVEYVHQNTFDNLMNGLEE